MNTVGGKAKERRDENESLKLQVEALVNSKKYLT